MLDSGDFNVARPSMALQELTQMMTKVVEEGTGTAVQLSGISVAGKRFGFRLGLEVGDFRLGVIASGESFVGFVAGTGIRFGPLGG